MNLVRLKCAVCGEELLERETHCECPCCGAHWKKQSTAEEREKLLKLFGEVLAEEKEERIANIRRNLWRAVHEKYTDSAKIKGYCRELKNILPDDFQANFYEAANGDDMKALNRFIDGIDAEKQAAYLDGVVDFTVKSLDLKNVASLKNLVERAKNCGVMQSAEYTAAMTKIEDEAARLSEGIYCAALPRDVFVAYSSADMARVNEIVGYLEEQGLSCFVALRNLRHGRGAAASYRENLETAMRSCRCAVFLSSENSRSLGCEALGSELPYLRDNLPDTVRIEFILEEYGKSTSAAAKRLLKQIFSGLEYCRDREDLLERILSAVTASRGRREAVQSALSAGEWYLKGKEAYRETDYVSAVRYYTRAAERGHDRAQCCLANCYENGYGVNKDCVEAAKWYTEAAVRGNAAARYSLGDCYANGTGVNRSYSKAVKWYRKSARQGNTLAQYRLGVCYGSGKGVRLNHKKAVRWFKKAAEQGNAEAQCRLGDSYFDGRGVKKNYAEAAAHYLEAAGQEFAEAQYKLGICYENGWGVARDYAQAVGWYKRAAEQGYAEAQSRLGMCYDSGKGVKKDGAEAVKWYKRAAEQGIKSATKLLERVKKYLE